MNMPGMKDKVMVFKAKQDKFNDGMIRSSEK
jgi:hypothetical protein